MDCSYFCERINEYVDGEMGYMEVAELQAHLSFCADCALELAQIGELRGMLADWGRLELAPQPGFAERVMAAVELEPAPDAPRSVGQLVDETLRRLDDRLGSISLPGGHTIPVKNLIGWGLATAAVVIGLERRHERGSRELPL
jgi:anti-sigma factor RsiW